MTGLAGAPAGALVVRDPDVPAIRVRGVRKSYGHLEALRGADLDLRRGEVLALVGDNGAGKSTLTKIICGALSADEGELAFWGEPVRVQSIHHAHELGVHTVYQDLALAPDLSVADNLFLGRETTRQGLRGRLGTLDRDRMRTDTRDALARLGIDLRSMSVPVRNLSGGQRQALAVARAINWATTAVLMDEPTAALGPKQSAIVYDTVSAAAARGLSVLVISHDIPRMLQVADRVAVMRHGTVITEQPARSLRLADVIGLMLGEEVRACSSDQAGAATGPAIPDGQAATAERIHAADALDEASETQATIAAPEEASGILGQASRSSAFWIGLVVVGLLIVFGLLTPNNAYVKPSNLLNIGTNASQIILLAVGMTFLIGSGHLDLSVGYNLILSSVLSAKVMVALGGSTEQVAAGEYPNLWLSLVAGGAVAVLAASLFGLLNGLLVTRLKLNSFIVTLATAGIFYGIALILTSAANVPFLPNELQRYFGSNRLGGVLPLPLLITLIICAVLWYVLRATRFGMRTLALGSSRESTVRAGIDVDIHVVRLFVLQGVMVGVAAFIDLARNASTNVVGHQTDNLQAISAVVLGGTSLFGGIASIGGTLLGSLIPVMMANGLVIMNVQPFYQLVVVGVILLIAVYLDQRRRARLS